MSKIPFSNKDIDSAISYLSYLFPHTKFKCEKTAESISFAGETVPNDKSETTSNEFMSLRDKVLTITNEEIKETDPHSIIVGKKGNGEDLYWNQKISPNLVISGHTGSGKTSLINTIMRNILIKDDSPVIYLSDIRSRLPENKSIHQIRSEKELFDVLTKVIHLITDRTNTFFELSSNKIDENGYIRNDEYILINDRLYTKGDIVKLERKEGGTPLKMKVEDIHLLDNFDDYLIELTVNKNNRDEAVLVDLRPNKTTNVDGVNKSLIDPIYIIVEEYVNMCGNREYKIRELLEKIAAIGRSSNVHVIIVSQYMTRTILTAKMKCNTSDYFICSSVDDDQCRLITDSDCEYNRRRLKPGDAIHFDKRQCEYNMTRLYYSSEKDLIEALA